MRKKLQLSFVLLFASFAAMAQVTTSNIRGKVIDDQNLPLLGANIVAVHTPTGTTYGAITNEDGRYNLLNLRVGGPYTVSVSYIGFKTQEKNNVFLTLGQTFDLDASMVTDSQALDEVIVVSDQSGTFGDGRTGAETSVGRRELTRLPTISRSAQDFTRLEPTASGNSFGGRNDQFNNFWTGPFSTTPSDWIPQLLVDKRIRSPFHWMPLIKSKCQQHLTMLRNPDLQVLP